MTTVPPSIGPAEGLAELTEGELSVMTNAPETIEASVPRLTARFLGPSGVDGKTVNCIDTLLGAVDDTRPPNVNAPNRSPEFEPLKTTPSVISTPPMPLSVPDGPLGMRIPNAGRVRFNPVVLAGSVWISALLTLFGPTSIPVASAIVETLPRYVVPKFVLMLA